MSENEQWVVTRRHEWVVIAVYEVSEVDAGIWQQGIALPVWNPLKVSEVYCCWCMVDYKAGVKHCPGEDGEHE